MTDVELHAVVSGRCNGRPVVLGPSLGTTVALWEPQLALLERQFQVIRFDHRGHAGSDVLPGPYTLAELSSDVVHLLDSLHVSRAHYVGISLGGMIGMWLAAHAPDRVDRLALLSTSAHVPPASAWRDRAETVRTRGTAAIANTVVERWFTPGFRTRRPEVVTHYVEQLAAVPAESYAGCCDALAAMDLRGGLAAITAETLVVVGADDAATPPAHARVIASHIDGSRVVEIADAAHLANVERPDEIGRLIVEHLGAQ